MMDTLLQDVRYALRQLARRPGFTAVGVLTLALGIGANTAMFSLVHGVLLKPLPYDHADRLVMVWETSGKGGNLGLSRLDFEDWRAQNRSFAHFVALSTAQVTLVGGNEPDRVLGTAVTAGFFEGLGVTPLIGRTFGADTEPSGTGLVAVISERLWKTRFGGTADVLGRSIRLRDRTYTVVGVVPSQLDFPHATDVWLPLNLSLDNSARSAHNYHVLGTLKPNVSVAAAGADLGAIAGRLAQEYPNSNRNVEVRVADLQEQITGAVRPTLLLLSTMVALVLLIASANVANLLLVRTHGRQREIAVRAALGASEARLARQFLTESALLALVGGAAGVLLAAWTSNLFAAWGPLSSLPVRVQVAHPVVLTFALGLAGVTALLFGIAPALHATPVDPVEALKEAGGRGMTAQRLPGTLVIAEVAFAAILLVGAGLTARSLWRLERERLGFDPDHVLVGTVDLLVPAGGDSARAQAYAHLLPRLRALPGVQSAAVASAPPLTGDPPNGSFVIEGHVGEFGPTSPSAQWHIVNEDYFTTLHIPVMRGRAFQTMDRGGPDVLVISEATARAYWPGQDPIGRRVAIPGLDERTYNAFRAGKNVWVTIVGVVGDVRYRALGIAPGPDLYVPYFQHPRGDLTILIRTPVPLAGLQDALKDEVRAMNPDSPLRLSTLESLVWRSVQTPRFRSLLIGLFAALALMLAAVGIYGVASYTTAQRTAEIGIRMALGARSSHVLGAVAGRVVAQSLAGLTLGLGFAAALSKLVGRFLYGVPPTDGATFGGVAVVLALVALLACYLPARRATRVDPSLALRYE